MALILTIQPTLEAKTGKEVEYQSKKERPAAAYIAKPATYEPAAKVMSYGWAEARRYKNTLNSASG